MILNDLKAKKIAIVGMGVNNKGLAEYFRRQGIAFEVIDGWKSADELVGKLDNYDIIFRTPGLPYLSRAVQQAKEKGVLIYSQTKLFFDLCAAKIIGVTGTKGKGTTATLIAKILGADASRQARRIRVWFAGNIGQDPFSFLDQIKPDDWVVLELSSFQLQDMHKSPHIAVVLKITPDHLDHHKTFEEYANAKKNIVKFQTAGDFAVLNSDNEITRGFAVATKGKIFWNSATQKVGPGSYAEDGNLKVSVTLAIGVAEAFRPPLVMPVSEVGLLGKFNLENVTAATAAVMAAGVEVLAVIREVVRDFKGLPHRLELVAEKDGVKYYNDSFSTTPETAMAALSAFAAPIILIAGGSEKNSDYTNLGKAIAQSKVKALLAVGTTGPKIAKAAIAEGFKGIIVNAFDFLDRESRKHAMERIVEEAKKLAEPGDVVLLSPASASFDMFANYKHRGELFKKFVVQRREGGSKE